MDYVNNYNGTILIIDLETGEFIKGETKPNMNIIPKF